MPADSPRKRAAKINGEPAPETSDATRRPAPNMALWAVIGKASDDMSCSKQAYLGFIDHLSSGMADRAGSYAAADEQLERMSAGGSLPDGRVDLYQLVKVATDAFVAANGATAQERYAFNDDDLADVSHRTGVSLTSEELDGLWKQYLEGATIKPQLSELIWSYWMEQSGLVKTMEAIERRIRPVDGEQEPDPLANLEIDPLRPLNNLLWGYIEDEPHRVKLKRRAYEYLHEYGLKVIKAGGTQGPAGNRTDFLRAFHNLLYQCSHFYRHDGDTMQKVDGSAILAALREVHLLLWKRTEKRLADLWSTIRAEMLVQQWILVRPEFGEFLRVGGMVAYPEPWMDRVDTLRRLMNWGDASVIHYRNLAVYGERLLLSIRYGAWNSENDPAQAVSWARFWRAEIQGYVWAYRAVSGVDLGREQDE